MHCHLQSYMVKEKVMFVALCMKTVQNSLAGSKLSDCPPPVQLLLHPPAKTEPNAKYNRYM